MPTFLERYKSGEHEQVWDELRELGEEVRDREYYDDALAVARETMKRVRQNCETLIPRLQSLGWRFGYDWANPSAQNDVSRQPPLLGEPVPLVTLDKIEASNGTLPISLRAFYEIVGAVNFVGTPFKRPNWPSIEDGLDPLYIAGIEQAFDPANAEEVDAEASDAGDESEPPSGREIEIAPDFLHKYFISGAGSLTIELPNSHADAPLMFEGEPLPFNDSECTLVQYLRNAMKGGGFLVFTSELDWGVGEGDRGEDPTEDLAFLTEGLLPF